MKYLLAVLISASALLAEAGTMLRVSVWDETEKKPPHAKAEIWFKGHGSWFIASDIKFGSGAKELGRRPVGKKDTIFFYPDGRSGAEIKIPISPTKEMNPKGSHRDTLMIVLKDEEIEVTGLALKGATGKSSKSFSRSGSSK